MGIRKKEMWDEKMVELWINESFYYFYTYYI